MAADEHIRFRQRLAAYAAGLLDEGKEEAFLEHRARCEDCRRAFDDFMASDEAAPTERGTHIPAAMLARWSAARRSVRGLERAMVREHLKRCSDCRADLERLGETPEIEFVAALEMQPAPGWRERLFGSPPSSGAARVAEPVKRGRRRQAAGSPWVPWVLGGWATAATAAAVILLTVRPVPSPSPPAPPDRPVATGPTAPLTLEPVGVHARLRSAARGPDGSELRLVLSEESRYLELEVGALDLPEGDSLRAELLAGGVVVVARPLPRAAREGVRVIVGQPHRAFTPGQYRLRLIARPAPPARADTTEFGFRVVRPPPGTR